MYVVSCSSVDAALIAENILDRVESLEDFPEASGVVADLDD
jgi:hypothetical protein